MSDGRPFSFLAHPKTLPVCVAKGRQFAWAAVNPAEHPALDGVGALAYKDGPVECGTWFVRDGSGVEKQSRYMYIEHQANWSDNATIETDGQDDWRIGEPFSGWKLTHNAQGAVTGAQYVGWDAWLPVETKMYHWRCNRLGIAQNCVLKRVNGRVVLDFAGGKPKWYAPQKGWPSDRSGKEWSARPFAGTGDIPDFPATSIVDWRFGPSMKQPGGGCLMNKLARELLGSLGNVWKYPSWLCTETDAAGEMEIDLAAPWLRYDANAADLLAKLRALKMKGWLPGDAYADPEDEVAYRAYLEQEWGKEKLDYYTQAWLEWGRSGVLSHASALNGKMAADFAVRALVGEHQEEIDGETVTVEDWEDVKVGIVHPRTTSVLRLAGKGGALFAAPMTADTGQDGVGIWPSATTFRCKARIRNGRDTLLYNLRYKPEWWPGSDEDAARDLFTRIPPDTVIFWKEVGDDQVNPFADAVEDALENGECYGTGHAVNGLLDNSNDQNRIDLETLFPGIRIGDAFDLRLKVRSYSERVDEYSGRGQHAAYDPTTTELAAYVADEPAENDAFFRDHVTVGEAETVTHWCDWLHKEEAEPIEKQTVLPNQQVVTAQLHGLAWAGPENELDALEDGLDYGEAMKSHPETYFDDEAGCIVTKNPGSGDSCWRINAQWEVRMEARIVKQLPPAQGAGGGA